ncbi:hypothetical protein F2P81_013715 [Scophthalmus maximus]|uniref:Uncharacterized protein n=1 Tax=Scophthalmus maximus TaxID=52904 RepID=A0A6A4SM25_SCOMX|nr:hypothetical protein F2P81_013715 [Scophthalmus maximus]
MGLGGRRHPRLTSSAERCKSDLRGGVGTCVPSSYNRKRNWTSDAYLFPAVQSNRSYKYLGKHVNYALIRFDVTHVSVLSVCGKRTTERLAAEKLLGKALLALSYGEHINVYQRCFAEAEDSSRRSNDLRSASFPKDGVLVTACTSRFRRSLTQTTGPLGFSLTRVNWSAVIDLKERRKRSGRGCGPKITIDYSSNTSYSSGWPFETLRCHCPVTNAKYPKGGFKFIHLKIKISANWTVSSLRDTRLRGSNQNTNSGSVKRSSSLDGILDMFELPHEEIDAFNSNSV